MLAQLCCSKLLLADKRIRYNTTQPVPWVSLSVVVCPGATDKDAGQKIDSHHTSDVLSEHITVAQTSHSLLTSTHTHSECEGG